VKPWGWSSKPSKPRQGRQKTIRPKSLLPHPALDSIMFVPPRFHRGLLSFVAPRLAQSQARGNGAKLFAIALPDYAPLKKRECLDSDTGESITRLRTP